MTAMVAWPFSWGSYGRPKGVADFCGLECLPLKLGRSPGPGMAAVGAWPVPCTLYGRHGAWLLSWALYGRRGGVPVP